MFKLTMCAFDRHYQLLTHVHFTLDSLPPPEVLSLLVSRMASERIDGRLHPELHVGCTRGFVTRDEAIAHGQELRQMEPDASFVYEQQHRRF